MSENPRRSDWQVFGAVALISLGVLLLLERVDLPWLGMVREAFSLALRFVWPIAIIALGALLLISARRDRAPFHHGRSEAGEHRLYRSRSDRMIGGVLGGAAQYLGIDSTLVRIVFVVLSVIAGFWTGVLVYVVGLIFMPEEPRRGAEQVDWPDTSSWGTPGWTQPAPGSTETVQTPAPPAYQPPTPHVRPPSPAPTAADAPPPPEPPAADGD